MISSRRFGVIHYPLARLWRLCGDFSESACGGDVFDTIAALTRRSDSLKFLSVRINCRLPILWGPRTNG